MLKIYLDWNIISYLKEEEYIDLRNYWKSRARLTRADMNSMPS